MNERFYRFRPAASLLEGFEELERQEIFFSSPDGLNDPMEGYKNIIWTGDEIVWRNLLRHYLLCLLQTTSLVMLEGPDFKPEDCAAFVRMTDEDLPTAPIRDMLDALRAVFFENEAVRFFIDQIAVLGLRLRQDGLRSYLRVLQPIALDAVACVFAAHGLPFMLPGFAMSPTRAEVAEQIRQLMEAHAQAPDEADILLGVGETMALELALIDDVLGSVPQDRAHWLSLFRDFPRLYVEALPKLVFPDWATACFVTEPTNAAMWGIYGDGHRGACLIFRPNEKPGSGNVLDVGWTDAPAPETDHQIIVRHQASLEFQPVRYANRYPEIDFFSSLGTLPRSKLAGFWYCDSDGATSPIAGPILSEDPAWRRAYWESHGIMTTTKLPQWSHEDEYRLVLTSNFLQRRADAGQAVRYPFANLAGIAFGMKMSHADKLSILRIIERKMVAEGRDDFEFFQAEYDGPNGCIALRHLGLIRIRPEKIS